MTKPAPHTDGAARTPAAWSRLRGWSRPPVSLGVLVLGILLLIGAAWQALGAGRAQERTVTRVLQSHAAVAAWNYEQQATMMLRDIIEAVFHPSLHDTPFTGDAPVPASVAAVVAPEALLADRTDLTESRLALIAATRYAARIALNSDAFTATETVAEAETRTVRNELRKAFQSTPRSDWITGHEAIHAFELAGSPVVVIYSPRIVPSDTLLYALVVDPARLGPIFDRILSAGSLLPDPLVAGIPTAELLSVGLLLPDSERVVHGTATAGEWTGMRPLPKLGGIIAVTELLPGAEAHLILGDSPSSRAQFLLGMLALAIGLLVIAFSQIRREHALSRMRADFVSSVSHELRTPLALQRVFLDMLRLDRVTTDEERQWCFDNIDRESLRLAHLVENVLHFSRSEQGTMQVCAERALLAPILDDIVRAFQPLAATAGAGVNTELDPTVTAPVDPTAIRQVLMNLLENAVKYGRSGGTVTVSLALHGRAARVMVDDDGSGVPLDERDSIFEPHRRGRATIDSAIAGSGIGLAVVRELIHGHDGRVFVTESPAGGARFVIELPHARAERATSDPAAANLNHDAHRAIAG